MEDEPEATRFAARSTGAAQSAPRSHREQECNNRHEQVVVNFQLTLFVDLFWAC
jgi:hypothetical protein